MVQNQQDPHFRKNFVKLPACESILATYHLEVLVNISDRKTHDFLFVLRINEHLDTFHIPALLLLWY